MRRQAQRGGKVAVAYLGSMTNALAAQRALAMAAVHSEIVKEDDSGRGCGYALIVPLVQLDNVRAILSAAHIGVRRYEER